MIKFLGSLPCALSLIATTLLFVIAGTFLESWSQSHLFAAALTYHNPVFQILLGLYFINILFAALNRLPFKKKHTPFLLTHLGLLLLILGVFVKTHYGVQGSCTLAEGTGTSYIFLPQTYAIHIETPHDCFQIPFKKNQLGKIKTGRKNLEITLLEWIPHAQERVEGFIKGSWGHIIGLPPFEMKPLGEGPTLKTPEYAIFACRTDSREEIHFPGEASLYFTQDSQKKDYLVAFDPKGERFESPLEYNSYYVYNKGFGGYALFAHLPPHFPQLTLLTPLTRSWTIQKVPLKKEEATPCILVLFRQGEESEVVSLSYDCFGQKFIWPILKGGYKVRFQSQKKEIPYHLRLKRAQKINYLGTQNPYSYEAQLLIDQDECQLSMNHVYEKQGYRFYLANLMEPPQGARHIHIVVNHDPAKYFLTYPGAITLALGILLLYLQKRYA